MKLLIIINYFLLLKELLSLWRHDFILAYSFSQKHQNNHILWSQYINVPHSSIHISILNTGFHGLIATTHLKPGKQGLQNQKFQADEST